MTETAVARIDQLESWLANFTEFEKSAPGRSLPWLHRLREDAFARFCQTGFPTTKDEDWRFTNVTAISQASFHPARETGQRISAAELRPPVHALMPSALSRQRSTSRMSAGLMTPASGPRERRDL